MTNQNTSMTKMAWEVGYPDGSGVEYAVRYNSEEETSEDFGVVEFENCGIVRMPKSKIGWLIECLKKIEEEQGLKRPAKRCECDNF